MSDLPLPFIVADDGVFIKRPNLNDVYLSPQKEQHVVAASWPKGVVFYGGTALSAEQFQDYTFHKTGDGNYGCS